jgi:dihydroflavonol-4-reductase
MKSLVTGATGIIGANLVRELLSRKRRIRVLVRQTSDTSAIDGLGVEKVYGDVLDRKSIEQAARGCAVVFHCAAIFAYTGHSAEEMLATAGDGTENVVRAAARVGARRIVLTASSVVYGSSLRPRVIDEDAPGDETSISVYEQSKIEQLRRARECADNCGIELVCACPTLCVGPHDKRLTEGNAVITNFLRDPFRATWQGGVNIVSVRDVAAGHVLIADRGASGACYLLGADNLSWEGVHRTVAELCGVAGPLLRANHTASFVAALTHELASFLTGERPLVSRAQAKMVGRYYWYSSGRAGSLGYNPRSSRRALTEAIAWLGASPHVSQSLRARLRLSDEVLRMSTTSKEIAS